MFLFPFKVIVDMFLNSNIIQSHSRSKLLKQMNVYNSYQIINLMMPAAGDKNNFSCFLNNFKRLTGFFRPWVKASVLKFGRRYIIREVTVSVS